MPQVNKGTVIIYGKGVGVNLKMVCIQNMPLLPLSMVVFSAKHNSRQEYDTGGIYRGSAIPLLSCHCFFGLYLPIQWALRDVVFAMLPWHPIYFYWMQ